MSSRYRGGRIDGLTIPGWRTSTYTMIARCGRTGEIGLCATASSFSVGVRVPFVRAGLGVLAELIDSAEGRGWRPKP